MTTQSGDSPDCLHTMSMNFSPPKSEANPASVTTYSPIFRADRVANMLLAPWAMFANGNPWTNTGSPSRVCTRLGHIASFSRTIMPPTHPRLPAVTGSPSMLYATTILSSLARRSSYPVDSASIAEISEADVIRKPLSWGIPPTVRPPRPTMTFLSSLAFMSMAFFRTTLVGSMLRSLPFTR